ncbi:MAG: indole-3-glycerol phosphate synthase TrpC, partial [Verrucomicrobiota bacterium]
MNILDTIVECTRRDLAVARRMLPQDRLEQHVRELPEPPDFAEALRDRGERANIIAELKRASPSAGEIRSDFGVISLARELETAGAAALSVLTEVRFFRGSPTYLRAVSANVTIPVLRKDFIVDEYQVLKARTLGASAVLLIAAVLPVKQLRHLNETARALGMQTLVEVHNQAELDELLACFTPDVVGVNCRNLKTFETDLEVRANLLREIPDSCVKVAESGIRTAADVAALRKEGADAFLVGE